MPHHFYWTKSSGRSGYGGPQGEEDLRGYFARAASGLTHRLHAVRRTV